MYFMLLTIGTIFNGDWKKSKTGRSIFQWGNRYCIPKEVITEDGKKIQIIEDEKEPEIITDKKTGKKKKKKKI